MTAPAELALTATCPDCAAEPGSPCDPPPGGYALGRLHNRRVKIGWKLRRTAIETTALAMAPGVSLDSALRNLFTECLRTWDPVPRVSLAALPLSHPDEATRQNLRGRVKSLGGDLAARAALGDSDDQLQSRLDRAVAKIIRLDSEATP